MEDAIGQNAPAKMPPNCILVRRDGHEIYIEDSVAPIHSDDGQDAGAVLVFRDVTVARTLAAQVAHLAEHDALTGLPNRLLFADRLGQAIARAGRNESLIAVLFLDLDGFKRINDSLGHRIGDKLLESVAVRLEQCLRVPDTVSRLGGDEFVIMLLDVHQPEDAAIAARRILNAVADAHPIATHELYITASIGISVFPDDGLDTETLIKNADTAMYQAKESGRQTFKFFRPEMNVVAVERQAIEEALRGALERNEFTLHYQPKFNLKSGIIIGVEALLRWNHSTRGDIPPAQFISIAEDSGLMLSIGTWVLRTACGQAKTWADAGLPHITMAVNVSSIQLHDEEFLYQLTEVLEETGLDPRLLEIEVTESILMDRPELAARMFRVLREWGVRISIDDFGTGYSSLSYLGKLPLDAIKIDQAFVRQIDTNPEHKAIVGAIVSMAQSLKLRVIAEGVETAEELAFLKTRGCDETQGYLFSRALPADQFVSLLTASVS
jgi:diguanylate cyclase (GGDEF)-like protein